MKRMSIDELRANLKKSDERTRSNFTSNYYPYFNLKVGESAKVRFLPDLNEENAFGFYIEKYAHPLEIDGEKKNIPCLTMYGEACPICELSRKLYKKGDKETGKIYWKRMSRISQVLVVDDPLPADEETGENYTGKVKLLNIGFQLFNVIREGLGSEDFDEVPFAYEGGTDFTIKKTEGQGGYATYSIGSKFARKPTDIDPELYVDQMVRLETVLPNMPDIKEIERLLKAAQTGESLEDLVEDEDKDKDEDDVEATVIPIKKTTKAAKKVEEDDDDLEDEEEAILEQIRARRQAK